MNIMLIFIIIGAVLGDSESGTTETKTDICKMKPPVENGRAIIAGWFYNHSIDFCQYYEFGGRRTENGKANRFLSLSECSKTCRSHVPSFCFETPKETAVKAKNHKWTYNSHRGRCVKLYWETERTEDSNVFEWEGECLDICRDPDYGPCAQLPSEHGCTHKDTSYYRFNRTTQSCYLDKSLKCEGGENAFLTLNACYGRCGRFVKNKCKLPIQDLGMCSQYGNRYFFDRKEKKCKTYFGCDFHGIGFYNQSECYNTCERRQ